MRLLVARCEVTYTGRLSTVLPEATRLLMVKADGSFLVHDDAGGYKPLNWIRTDFRARNAALTPDTMPRTMIGVERALRSPSGCVRRDRWRSFRRCGG